jgi:hypothetical protein
MFCLRMETWLVAFHLHPEMCDWKGLLQCYVALWTSLYNSKPSVVLVSTLLPLASLQLRCPHSDLQAQGTAHRAVCLHLSILKVGWGIRMAVFPNTCSLNGGQ